MQNTTEEFRFSHSNLDPQETARERFFGAVPGALSWGFLLVMTALSFLKPVAAAVLVIAYHLYWLFRLFYMTLFLVLAYGVMAIDQSIDWQRLCHLLEEGEAGWKKLRHQRRRLGVRSIKQWLSYKKQEREIKRALQRAQPIPSYENLYHVVIIAVTKEPREVLEPGLQALGASRFPPARILPILAVEKRSGPEQEEMARQLQAKYRKKFWDFMVTVHPEAAGEARVKGANVTYAAKQAARFLEEKGIAFENVILSCFDADTVASPDYFAALTFHFMRNPHRMRSSYQPIPVYHNNVWEVPGFARVLEMGSSFFQLIEATNPEKLVTFSSHSISFKALVEIGYWPVDMISDDSAIFWKAWVHYRGDYRVVPMYVTLSMDVVTGDSLWKTLVNIYRQKRRWAWGVENFPIVMRAFCRLKGISAWKQIRYGFKLLEMHVSWATIGFTITFLGWLPAIFASREFSSSVLYYNSARISGIIFNLAFAFLVVTIILALLLLPRKRVRYPLFKRALLAVEWLLVPFVFTFLSSMPALDAQTRLMLGRGLEFQIAEKRRRKRRRL